MAKKAAGGKNRKYGRNAKWCDAYKVSGTREKNKARKLARHIKRYGTTDHMAVHRFNNLPELAKRVTGTQSFSPTPSKHKRKEPAYYGPAMGGDEVNARKIMARRTEAAVAAN